MAKAVPFVDVTLSDLERVFQVKTDTIRPCL